MRYSRNIRPQDPGELVDDGSFQCCVRIGRSRLLCGKKSSHFPYTWFVGPDWYCMCVTYILIIVPTVLFIRNVAVFYGAPIIVIAVVMCATTLTFFSLIACSDPGIVFEVKHVESLHNSDVEEDTGGHDIEMMSPASGPYSPVDSTDPVDQHQQNHQHHHHTNHSTHQELALTEPDLLNSTNYSEDHCDLEQGSYRYNCNKSSVNHQDRILNTIYTTHNVLHSSNSPSSDQNGRTHGAQDVRNSATSGINGTVNNGTISNRIVVGASQRASRGVHSSGTNALVNTSISAPYLPPPRIECGRCQIMRPRDASHCHDCGVCVKQLDHHCPWTGKCIGEKTIKNFYAFLMSLCFLIGFVVVVVIVAFAQEKDIFNFNHPGRE